MKQWVMLVGILGVWFISAGPLIAVEDELTPNIVQYIESAKTSEDHRALARIYHEEADRMWRKVESHQLMVQAYTRKFGNRMDKWLPHCQVLLEEYRKTAQTYEALAKAHEEEAKTLP